MERTALSLERKGNLRLLICVVEAWDEVGEPTRPALLAQIRALLALRVVDRAWARLQTLLDGAEGAPDVEAYRLGGKLLVDRGQHKEARALLTRARAQHPDDLVLRELLGRTHDPGTVLDVTDPLEDDPDGQTRLAERLLVEGAPLKARRLLERVRKAHPDHTRAADLLWALDGEFHLRGVTLADLARVHAASPVTLPADDEPEHTETLGFREGRSEALPLFDEPDTRGGFAGLFKNLDADPESTTMPPDEREVTLARALEDGAEATELTDGGDEHTTTGREDTQIMHVVRADGTSPDASAVDTLVDRPWDLREAPARPVLEADGETEDENVVVRRKIEHVEPDVDGHTQGRIRLDPSRERVQAGVATSDEAADFVRPRKRPELPAEPAPRPSDARTPAPAPSATGPQAVTPRAATPRSAAPARSGDARPKSAAQRAPAPGARSTPAPVPARDARSPEGRPRLNAAPAASPQPPPGAVALEKKRTPPGAPRRKLDPALAAAPTLILEDGLPRPTPPRFQALAPWTGWLLMLAFLGLLVVTVGVLIVLWQVFSYLG